MGRRRKVSSGSSTRGKKRKSPVTTDSPFKKLRLRTSPRELCDAISRLGDTQRKNLREMGFGKLLRFKVNGMAGRLAHYVVDHFNPNTMEIETESFTIKVDSESINKLLGIPKSGLELKQPVAKEKSAESILRKQWKARYTMLTTRAIVEKINDTKDYDGAEAKLMFQLDFIVLFYNTMIETHTNGVLKLAILDQFSEDTNFGSINWCLYLEKMIKKCKDGWRSENKEIQFRGPITILVLMYVDSILCKGINENRTTDAISFWDLKNLQKRERLEIEAGKFGMGDYRGLFEEIDREETLDLRTEENRSVDARSDKRRKTGTDRITRSRSSSRGRQAQAPVNNQKEVSVAPSEVEALESENFEFTKEEVDALLSESFRLEKSDSKAKQEWTTGYVKRLKACIKWLQKSLQDNAEEKDTLREMLDPLERRCVGTEAAMKSKEEELNATISKLETNVSTLEESLAKKESEKQVAETSSRELRTKFEESEKLVSDLQDRLTDAKAKLLEGENLRKELHNTILDLERNH